MLKASGRSFYKASVPYPQVACSRTRRTKNNTPLIELAKVWRGCRIVLALLVSHRAKLWASTITHPCVCGRLGRCIVQRLCATAIVHPLHVYERSVGFASCLVSRLGCHIVWQLSAAAFKHPCLKLWAFIL